MHGPYCSATDIWGKHALPEALNFNTINLIHD